MRRAVVAVLLLIPILAACGAQPARKAPRTALEGDTLLARVGSSLVAMDAGTGRTLQRVPLGAHDAALTAVYTAVQGADGRTTVIATDPVSGRRLRSMQLAGAWAIPVAAGTAPDGALSGDGAVLVLAGSQAGGVSRFALVPTDFASAPRRFALRGRYAFDAMAPDASQLYVNEVRDDGRYRVRSYDVQRGVLLPRVVVEKTALGLLMEGVPVARAVDPSGSPVHTLYRGGPAGAFVHSLDTANGTALCIFVPDSSGAGPTWRISLDAGRNRLHALNRELATQWVIDPVSGAVAVEPPDAPAPGSVVASEDGTRRYRLDPDGTIVVRDSAGTTVGTLPSPAAGAELLAVRQAG